MNRPKTSPSLLITSSRASHAFLRFGAASCGLGLLLMAAALPPAAHAQAADERYPEPPKPILLPEDAAPVMSPMDAEVDKYIDIDAARKDFGGLSGAGLTVAVIDGGINRFHQDFVGKIRAERNFSQENAANENDASDFNGHGSNVSSIIAGLAVKDGGMNTGIAHNAEVVALKVFPGGSFDKISAALQWVVDHHKEHHISVVNMSLGTTENLVISETSDAGRRKQAKLIEELRGLRIPVVVAAGNSYFSYQTPGMAFPAIVPQCISVGAIYDIESFGDPPGAKIRSYLDGSYVRHTFPGRCTAFTQRLDNGTSAESFTDVFAPGFFVTAAGPLVRKPSGVADTAKSRTTLTTQDGTSQASPVVSGLVLLIQERYRMLTKGLGGAASVSPLPPVELVEDCLRKGGVEFVDEEEPDAPEEEKEDNVKASGKTFHRINAVGALTYLDQRLKADHVHLAAQLFQAADEAGRRAAVQEATILDVPVAAPQAEP